MNKRKEREYIKRRSRPFSETRNELLQDDEVATGYLQDALASQNKKEVLIALRNLIEARGEKMSHVAKKLNMSRSTLYYKLSERGNPDFISMCSILNAIGFEFSINTMKR